jgi:hypothetical protein
MSVVNALIIGPVWRVVEIEVSAKLIIAKQERHGFQYSVAVKLLAERYMRAQQVKQAREPEPLTYRNVYGVL